MEMAVRGKINFSFSYYFNFLATAIITGKNIWPSFKSWEVTKPKRIFSL